MSATALVWVLHDVVRGGGQLPGRRVGEGCSLDLIESEFKDVSWKDHDHFLKVGAVEGAIRTAENDAMRRGPNFPFKIRWEGETYPGNAERYVVRLSSPKPIPEALRRRFRVFLEKLVVVPFEVRDVKIEGNTTTDLP